MTAVVATTATVPTTSVPGPTDRRPLWRSGACAGVLAAAAVVAIAGGADAAGVPIEVDGAAIPLLGFAQLTLICVAIGVLLAKASTRWARRPRGTFVATTVGLTVLSIVPDLTFPMTTATRVTMIATHLVAAGIAVPAIAGRLSTVR